MVVRHIRDFHPHFYILERHARSDLRRDGVDIDLHGRQRVSCPFRLDFKHCVFALHVLHHSCVQFTDDHIGMVAHRNGDDVSLVYCRQHLVELLLIYGYRRQLLVVHRRNFSRSRSSLFLAVDDDCDSFIPFSWLWGRYGTWPCTGTAASTRTASRTRTAAIPARIRFDLAVGYRNVRPLYDFAVRIDFHNVNMLAAKDRDIRITC
ncbi:hypothetical protein D3C76_1205060 [compost metagenome]